MPRAFSVSTLSKRRSDILMGRIFLTRTGLHPWIKPKGMLSLENALAALELPDLGGERIAFRAYTVASGGISFGS